MRVLVVGAGAVGCYFGAMLAKSGCEVVFLARGEAFNILRSNGLIVKSINGDYVQKVNAVNNANDAGKVDLVLMCVKSYDTEEATGQIKNTISNKTITLSLQNGVDNADKIGTIIGKENVIAGVVLLLAEIAKPWTLQHYASGKLIIGELDGSESERVLKIAGLFENAKMPCSISKYIYKEMWKKLIWNAAFNPLTAITNSSTKDVLANVDTRKFARQVMLETLNAARRCGHDIDENVIDEYIKISENPGFANTSMMQDMLKRKRLEFEAINGYVASKGEEFGIPTPYNNMLYTFLKLNDCNAEIQDKAKDLLYGI